MADIAGVYDYLRNVGVNGKTADSLVTTDLELIQKPHWLIRPFFIFLKFFGISCVNTDLSQVIHKVDSLIASGLDDDMRLKAEFVKKALDSIKTKKDPHLVILASLNVFGHQVATCDERIRQEYLNSFDEYKADYIAGRSGSIFIHNVESKRVTLAIHDREWRRPDESRWLALLPAEMSERIFLYLNEKDLGRVQRTCWSLNAVASSCNVWLSCVPLSKRRIYELAHVSATDHPQKAMAQRDKILKVLRLRQHVSLEGRLSLWRGPRAGMMINYKNLIVPDWPFTLSFYRLNGQYQETKFPKLLDPERMVGFIGEILYFTDVFRGQNLLIWINPYFSPGMLLVEKYFDVNCESCVVLGTMPIASDHFVIAQTFIYQDKVFFKLYDQRTRRTIMKVFDHCTMKMTSCDGVIPNNAKIHNGKVIYPEAGTGALAILDHTELTTPERAYQIEGYGRCEFVTATDDLLFFTTEAHNSIVVYDITNDVSIAYLPQDLGNIDKAQFVKGLLMCLTESNIRVWDVYEGRELAPYVDVHDFAVTESCLFLQYKDGHIDMIRLDDALPVS